MRKPILYWMASSIWQSLYIVFTSSTAHSHKKHIIINFSCYLAKQKMFHACIHETASGWKFVSCSPRQPSLNKITSRVICWKVIYPFPAVCFMLLNKYNNFMLYWILYNNYRMFCLFLDPGFFMFGAGSYDTVGAAREEVISYFEGTFRRLSARLQ